MDQRHRPVEAEAGHRRVVASVLVGGPARRRRPGMDATSAIAAPTPVVSVTPATGANPAGQALPVSGSNVSTTANGGIGIYVAFGPDPATLPPDKSVNPAYYQNVAWTHPSPAEPAPRRTRTLEPDGTFSYNLTQGDGSPITAVYTTSTGTYDCTQIECGIVTFTAHGVPDRTQDTFTPVSFAPEIATTIAAVHQPHAGRTRRRSPRSVAPRPYTWSHRIRHPPGRTHPAARGRRHLRLHDRGRGRRHLQLHRAA